MRNPWIVAFILICLFIKQTKAQDIPFGDYTGYPFLNTTANRIILPEKKEQLHVFFQKLADCQRTGKGTVKILHIGDSHIQADFFSGQTRQRFHETFPGCNGGLNLVFPYKAAKTNSSYLHTSEATGEWISCRNVQSDQICPLGVTGISLTTTDSIASIAYRMRRQQIITYTFNELTILSLNDTAAMSLEVPGMNFTRRDTTGQTVLHTFVTTEPIDSITMRVTRSDTSMKRFTLFGFLLSNGDDGIVYNSAGINGADVRCFLRCNQLFEQTALLAPDLVIVSLGTNDCYSERWDSTVFEQNLMALVGGIRRQLPGAAILLTTPPDHYRKRRYNNTDVITAANVIFRVAKQYDAAVWDLFSVMGGLQSVREWLSAGLANRDKIHFTREGYMLQGNLLFEAIIQAWSDFIDTVYVAGTTD